MRSSWKLPYTLRRFNYLNILTEDYVDDFDFEFDFLRNVQIPMSLEGFRAEIYNGVGVKKILINVGMVGHKFGEFATTKVIGLDYREAVRLRKKKKKKRKK